MEASSNPFQPHLFFARTLIRPANLKPTSNTPLGIDFIRSVIMSDDTPEITKLSLTAADFAVLGLRFSEARTAVIRQAIRHTIRKLQESDADRENEPSASHRADVAVATYRIIDPRRRQRFWERVNLSFGLSFEDESVDRKRIVPWQLPELAPQASNPRKRETHHFDVSP